MMSQSESDQPRFDTRTGQLIRRCLRVCRYHEDLVEEDYTLASDRMVPLVAFAHRPHDARSSCIAFFPESRTPHADIAGLRELCVPFAFFVGDNSWEMWSLRSDGPRRERPVPANKVEQFFEDRKNEFAPGSVFRAKTWARVEGARQLDFVDTGLLPIVEQEAGARLRQLFEDMVAHTMDALDMTSSGLSEADAHWMMKANFWLLAGKILRDKQVPKFAQFDLNDVQDVFDRVAEHYGAKRVRANGRLTAVRGAAAVAAAFSSFRSISTETLGALYEEALLSERTRKLWSIHRTPTYLVDYMLAKLSHWMEEDIGIQNCRIFEPACGHAPFLVGAVRLMSDLLPDNIASDRAARRQFLRKHLSGCDRDAFALEIARLSLTLADIPNPNGWRLDAVKDMFEGDYLDQNIAASSLVLVNPPFESATVTASERANGDLRFHRNGQAAELLRRLLRSSEPGTAFGIVVPQTILEGNWFTTLRRELLEQCDIREITVFPDKVFQFADVETGIILARKRPANSKRSLRYLFRRVREAGMAGFTADYRADQDVQATIQECQDLENARLLIPRLSSLWKANANLPRFNSIALIAHGLFFLPKSHTAFPNGATTVSETQRSDLIEGYASATGKWETHLAPLTVWLNLNPKIIEWPMEGVSRGQPQVLLNKARVSRSEWRHKAFIDSVGHPFTHRFIVFRPKQFCALELLWALCNSPYANAYTYTDSGKRDLSATFLREMPVPQIENQDLIPLIKAVRAYLAAAREFSEKQKADRPKFNPASKGGESTSVGKNEQLILGGIESERRESNAVAQDDLRRLHWRVDAEVLKLYALPAELERELLDYFDGAHRVGVPFQQTGYIPLDFREVQRLDEFLRITDEWEQTDERRCQLIENRIKRGHRTADEEAEFQELQRLFDLRRAYLRWSETGDAHSPLFDEKKLRELKEEDQGGLA
jgi:type I restriction-modification system DNA methylase subunit